MKILHINEHSELKGGVETYLFSAIPLLEEKGIHSSLAYSYGDLSQDMAGEKSVVIGEIGFVYKSGTRREMRDIFQSVQPDIIHIHNVQNTGVVKASFDYGPTVITTHDYRWVCPANSFFYKNTKNVCHKTCGLTCFTTTLRKHCLTPRPKYAANFYHRAKWTSKHSDKFAHIITPSRGAKKRYTDGGFPEENITVLPYFCSLKPSAQPRKLPPRKTITYLGRIAPNKGHEFFIKALGQLPEEVHGVMVGGISKDAEAELLSLAKKHGCEERLHLHGWASREEVLEIMDNTSVFVFPSLWPETLGIVGIEALSRGVPVVASDLGGVTEWCIDDETGFTVPPKDFKMIAEKVGYLLEDDQRLIKFGENGIELIKKKFLPETHIDSLIEVYKKAAEAV